jgi:hypothetical protein
MLNSEQNVQESPTINIGSDDSDEYQTPSEMLTEASACEPHCSVGAGVTKVDSSNVAG